jgi:hypothetical protein
VDEAADGRDRAIELRRKAFERAGFQPGAAQDLAERLDLDLQQALGLVKHGFPPEVAYGMLTSGSRPVF